MTSRKIKVSTIGRAIQVIPKEDKSKIFLVVALQIFLGLLDLAGVAAIGVLGALAVAGVQSQQPGNRISDVLNFLHLQSYSFQSQAAALALIATLILVSKTIFSILITKKIYFFLSRRGALITSELMSKLLSQSILTIQSRSTQDNLYSITIGVGAITLSVLGSLIALIADGSLLIILLLGLVYVDPIMALTTFLFFGSLGWILYKVLNVRAQELGRKNFEISVQSNQKITEVLETFRESVVHNRRYFYATEVKRLRLKLSDILAETQFLPNISKYILESGIVLGAVLIAGAQFLLQDARHAVAALAVFLASGSRIAPAVMRIQQSAIQIRGGLGAAEPTLNMIEEFSQVLISEEVEPSDWFSHDTFSPKILLDNVSFTYPSSPKPALSHIRLEIKPGQSVAIVGPSGSGKTTLVDVLLGVLTPDHGRIEISGLTPNEAIKESPGAISYVPQNVKVIEGTIRENVALGFPAEIATDDLVNKAISKAQLNHLISNTLGGLDSQVGESGGRISGGQRQRLGIARAFFTNPKLLVLDEATSALDGSTEFEITKTLNSLKGSVTVVTIAHRLSTVRDSDLVIYLEDGKIIAQGSFNHVRSAVPDFDSQAKLMGL